MYLFHLRGNCIRGDGGQVLRAKVLKESGEVTRASAPKVLGWSSFVLVKMDLCKDIMGGCLSCYTGHYSYYLMYSVHVEL